MSNVSSLRYVASLIAIVCCLILPWTVQWVSKSNMGYAGSGAGASVGQMKAPPFLLNLIQEKPSPSDLSPYIIKSSQGAASRRNNYWPNGTIKSNAPQFGRNAAPLAASQDLDLQNLCKKNSTSTLTYYFFEMHILLFYLSILSCSCFIQMYFYYKLLMMLLSLVIYIVALNYNKIFECLAQTMEFNLPFLKAEIIIQSVFFIIFLHLIDRRV
jgi:hypothetical protein